ncbi:MAG: RNA-binding domain-containing protein [Bacilli bacterium]
MKYIESKEVELKISFVNDLDKEIISFLNSNDGTIYIGVDDNGNVIGINSDRTKDDINLKIGNIISDAIYPNPRDFIDFKYNEENVLVIKIKKGNKRPYYLKDKGPKSSGTYIRVGSSKRPATEEEILSMIMDTRKYSYEKEESEEQNLHFDYAKMISKSKNIDFDERSFLSLGILNKENKYTNLGLLISDENPIVVKFAKYDNKLDFLIKKEFTGSIIKITDQILDYAELLNTTSAIIPNVGGMRIETKSFPGKSLREAIINAICHANYLKPSNIKIEFYDDRVEITSPGGIFDGDLNLILKGYQTFRNPGLIRILALFDYIENYGKGLKRIQEAYSKESRKYEFDVNETFFRIILPDLNYKNINDQKNGNENGNKNGNEKIGKIEEEILKAISKNPSINLDELVSLTNKGKRTISRYLKELQNKNYIIREGSNRKGKWVINIAYKNINEQKNGNENGNENGNKNGNENGNEKIGKIEEEILTAISKNPSINLDELVSLTNKGKRTISRYLKELQNKNYIIREGSNRKGKWIINKNNSKL